MAQAFLVQIAQSLGRDEAACPFIKRLIEDEWLLTVDDLRIVPRHRWENFRVEYKIPARFVDAVVLMLSSPYIGGQPSLLSSSAKSQPTPNLSSSPVDLVELRANVATGPGKIGSLAWAAKQPFEQQLRRIWDAQRGPAGSAASEALMKLLSREENVHTYGILGVRLEKATLKGVAAFAKGAWMLRDGQSVTGASDKIALEPAEHDLFEALGMVEEKVNIVPEQGNRYASVVVVGDCGLKALRKRIEFCQSLMSKGALGQGAMIHICAGAETHPDDHSENASVSRTSAVEAIATEILKLNARRTVVSCIGPCGKAEDIFRAWLGGPQHKDAESGPALLVSAQPFALHHRAVFDNVVRERPTWQKRCPPWLVHVAAPAAPTDVPRAMMFDVLGQILDVMSKRKRPAPLEDNAPAWIPPTTDRARL